MNTNNELLIEKNQNDITKNMENQLEKEGWNDIGNQEIWKPIPEFEDRYLISSYGRIKSLSKNIILKLKTNSRGYFVVGLWRNQKSRWSSLHRLIAKIFLKNLDTTKIQINHKDGNKLNNHISNLEWVTAKENVAHSIKNGLNKTIGPGDGHQGAKLTMLIVDNIRNIFLEGKTPVNELCNKYNIDDLAIRRILMNRTWYNSTYGCAETLVKVRNILKHWECKNKTFYKKFNISQIDQIIEMRKNGASIAYIGTMFKVYRQTIARIIKNEASRII